jgi:hypothetical protein
VAVGHNNKLNQPSRVYAVIGLQAGLARFPHSAHMVLVYVNFLGSVVNSQQACSSQLQATKKLEPNWLDRCEGFSQLLSLRGGRCHVSSHVEITRFELYWCH